jgi:hypothetical protein
MRQAIKQIIYTELVLFITFQLLLYIIKGGGYIISATVPIMVLLSIFTLIYLIITIVSSVLSIKVKQEFLNRPSSIWEFLLRYRLLIFFYVLWILIHI